ncbi:ATP-binding cassette domain-containing protein [Micrococcaceae bacterium Sec5.1]
MPEAQNPFPTIALDQVFAGYTPERPVFEDASFTLTGPALVHVKGSNGSGKSTLVELVSGYLRPWQGKVIVSGLSASDPNSRDKRRICRSEPSLFAPMTAKDHIRFACIARDSDPGPELDRAIRLGMGEWLDENAGNLSTGNTRKLWYLMNTVGNFDTVMLDEPFNGVDAHGAHAMAAEIRSWVKTKLVVIITHSLQDLLPEAKSVSLEELVSGHRGAGARK